jgi:hypothetical protein
MGMDKAQSVGGLVWSGLACGARARDGKKGATAKGLLATYLITVGWAQHRQKPMGWAVGWWRTTGVQFTRGSRRAMMHDIIAGRAGR